MKIITKLTRVSPYYMFCKQVEDNMASIRSAGEDYSVTPLQFGGLFGQKGTLDQDAVMEIITIDGGTRAVTTKARKPGA